MYQKYDFRMSFVKLYYRYSTLKLVSCLFKTQDIFLNFPFFYILKMKLGKKECFPNNLSVLSSFKLGYIKQSFFFVQRNIIFTVYDNKLIDHSRNKLFCVCCENKVKAKKSNELLYMKFEREKERRHMLIVRLNELGSLSRTCIDCAEYILKRTSKHFVMF